MRAAKLGRGRMLAIAMTPEGAVIAFGTSRGDDAFEAEENFADALERVSERLPAQLTILVEASPSWRRATRRVTFADIQNAAFIINA